MRRQFPYKKLLGFTLIEMLVVVSLVGTFSTVALVSINDVRMMVRDVQRQKELESLATALELYYLDHQAYPQDGSDTDCVTSAGTVSRCPPYAGLAATIPSTHIPSVGWNSGIPLHILVTNGYIHKLPVDPLNRDGYWYAYRTSSDNRGYVILALKETGGGILKIGGPMGGVAQRDLSHNGVDSPTDASRVLASCGRIGNTPEMNALNGCDDLMDIDCSGSFEIMSTQPDFNAMNRVFLGFEEPTDYCPSAGP